MFTEQIERDGKKIQRFTWTSQLHISSGSDHIVLATHSETRDIFVVYRDAKFGQIIIKHPRDFSSDALDLHTRAKELSAQNKKI